MLETISLTGYILLGALVIAGLIQLYYYWGVFGKFAFYKPQPTYKNEQEPISVIIAARNELENLQKFLPAILNQNYPEFEVVVVNHCSWDMSQQYLEEMQLQYPHLRVSQLLEQEKYPTGKKFAITIGVKAAKYDILVFTDADCLPSSDRWLANIQSRFVNNIEIVLGYSPNNKRKGFLNLMEQFETFMTAVLYFSFALGKKAFMGVGRNMAYRKEVFFRHKGFASHQHIMSGDDDLFINKAATPYNVAIECSADSFMYTDAKASYEKWSRQKSRHMTTGKYYKREHKVLLGVYYASIFCFYGVLIALLCTHIVLWPVVLGAYLVRLISQSVVLYQSAVKLKNTSALWFLPVLDLVYVWYLLVFGTKGLVTKNAKSW